MSMVTHLYLDGDKLLALRKREALTQQKVATEAGLSAARLRTLERGQCNSRLDTVARLAAVLGADPRELLGVRMD